MDNECFPCIPLSTATRHSRESDSPVIVKEEPMSEPGSPDSCPMSPSSPPSLMQTDVTMDQPKVRETFEIHSLLITGKKKWILVLHCDWRIVLISFVLRRAPVSWLILKVRASRIQVWSFTTFFKKKMKCETCRKSCHL